MKQSNKSTGVLLYLILILLTIVIAFPLVYTVAASFKTNSEILSHPENIFPHEPTFDNYRMAVDSDNFNLKRLLWNSTYYTLICLVFNLFSSSMAGYVFARGNFRGKKIWWTIFSSLMFINLGSITVYPMFDVLSLIRLNRSLWGLIVVRVFGLSVVNIYLVRSYIRTIPSSLDEAAKLDGCSFFGIYARIILPTIKPIIATIGILAFQHSWNEFLMPSIFTMSNPSQRTLIVGVVALKNSGDAAASWNLMLAGAVVALLPVLIAYVAFNKYFVSGLTSGAVKG